MTATAETEYAELVKKLYEQGSDAFHRHYSLGMFKLCANAADAISALLAENARLKEALKLCGTGGNHIASVLIGRLGAGEGFPPYGSKHDEVLEKLGYGDTYEIWCCWDAMMRSRSIAEGASCG